MPPGSIQGIGPPPYLPRSAPSAARVTSLMRSAPYMEITPNAPAALDMRTPIRMTARVIAGIICANDLFLSTLVR